MNKFEIIWGKIVKVFVAIGTVFMLSAMFICVTNIVTRIFKVPILGTYEFIELSSVPAVTFAIIYTAFTKSNVSMELLFSKLSRKIQNILTVVFTLFCLIISILMSWSNLSYAAKQLIAKEVTIVMRWPVYPFRFVFGIGMALVSLVLAIQLIKVIKGDKNGTC